MANKPDPLKLQTAKKLEKVVELADELIEQGINPNSALAKAAVDQNLNLNYLPLAVRALNNAQAWMQLNSSQDPWQRAAKYPVVQEELVKEEISKLTKQQVQKKRADVISDTRLIFSDLLSGDKFQKAASDSNEVEKATKEFINSTNPLQDYEDFEKSAQNSNQTERLFEYIKAYHSLKAISEQQQTNEEQTKQAQHKKENNSLYNLTNPLEAKSHYYNCVCDFNINLKQAKEIINKRGQERLYEIQRFIKDKFPQLEQFLIEDKLNKKAHIIHSNPYYRAFLDKELVKSLVDLEHSFTQLEKVAQNSPSSQFWKNNRQILQMGLHPELLATPTKKEADHKSTEEKTKVPQDSPTRRELGEKIKNYHTMQTHSASSKYDSDKKKDKDERKGAEKGESQFSKNKRMLLSFLTDGKSDKKKDVDSSEKQPPPLRPKNVQSIDIDNPGLYSVILSTSQLPNIINLSQKDMKALAKAETLIKLLKSDELSGYSKKQIVDAYNELSSLAPNSMMIEPFARSMVAQRLAGGPLPPFEISNLMTIEKKYVDAARSGLQGLLAQTDTLTNMPLGVKPIMAPGRDQTS